MQRIVISTEQLMKTIHGAIALTVLLTGATVAVAENTNRPGESSGAQVGNGGRQTQSTGTNQHRGGDKSKQPAAGSSTTRSGERGRMNQPDSSSGLGSAQQGNSPQGSSQQGATGAESDRQGSDAALGTDSEPSTHGTQAGQGRSSGSTGASQGAGTAQ